MDKPHNERHSFENDGESSKRYVFVSKTAPRWAQAPPARDSGSGISSESWSPARSPAHLPIIYARYVCSDADYQIILRNENFTPPAIGGHDRSNYLKLTSIQNLLGRAGQLFLLFGMLSRDPAGRLCLEDGEGRVMLDMEDAVSHLSRYPAAAGKAWRNGDAARALTDLRLTCFGRVRVGLLADGYRYLVKDFSQRGAWY